MILLDLSLELPFNFSRGVIFEACRQFACLGVLLDHEFFNGHLREEVETHKHVLPSGRRRAEHAWVHETALLVRGHFACRRAFEAGSTGAAIR